MSKARDWGWNDVDDYLPPWGEIVIICTEDGSVHYGIYNWHTHFGYENMINNWYFITENKVIWDDDKDISPHFKVIGWSLLLLPETYEMPCKWATVNQLLPPSGQRVLAYISSGDICTAFYSSADQCWHFMIGLNSFVPTHEQYASGKYTVLAWSELPTYPYKPLQSVPEEGDV
jgi:hypothetical protein